MSQILTALGGHEVIIYSPDRPAERLCDYLTERGSLVSVVGDPAELIRIGRQSTTDVVVVSISPAGGELELCRALKEGTYPPVVISLCDRNIAEEVEALGKEQPDESLTRPAPFAMLLGLIEKHVAQRHERLSTSQPPLLFGELLMGLFEKEQSGMLRITAGGQTTTIYLRHGVPVFAEHGSLGDTLGRILLRAGRIDESQFSKAVDLITERLVDNEQLRLGEALIELGYLTASEIFEALRSQVRRKIAASFAWDNFHADFREGEEHLEGVNDFSIPVHQAIIHGIKQEVPPERLERFVAPFRSKYVRVRFPIEEVAARYELAEDESTVLLEIDGQRTVEQLQVRSKLDRVHVDQLLCALQLCGELELADAKLEEAAAPRPIELAAPAESQQPKKVSKLRSLVMSAYVRLAGRSDREVLELAPDATPEDVEKAYQVRARPYLSPEFDDEPEVVRETAREVINKLSGARDRLTSHRGLPAISLEPKPIVDAKRARLAAGKAFQRGKHLLALGQARPAAVAFDKAAQLVPKEVEYRLFAAWLTYLLAQGDAVASAREQARKFAHRMLKLDRHHAKALFVIGRIYVDRAEPKTAFAILKKAAAQDPDDVDIARELRLLRSRGHGR